MLTAHPVQTGTGLHKAAEELVFSENGMPHLCQAQRLLWGGWRKPCEERERVIVAEQNRSPIGHEVVGLTGAKQIGEKVGSPFNENAIDGLLRTAVAEGFPREFTVHVHWEGPDPDSLGLNGGKEMGGVPAGGDHDRAGCP